MTPHSNTGDIKGDQFAGVHAPVGIIGGAISHQSTDWTAGLSRFRNKPVDTGPYNSFQKDTSMGTYSNQVVKANPSIAAANACLDAEIDVAVRRAVALLNMQYEFREPDQVKSFLSGNNTLRRMLSAIHSKIRREFTSEKIILEVFSDSPRSSEKDVVVSVTTSLPVDEAIERLDRVEDVKWDKDSRDPYVDICVKLEYQ